MKRLLFAGQIGRIVKEREYFRVQKDSLVKIIDSQITVSHDDLKAHHKDHVAQLQTALRNSVSVDIRAVSALKVPDLKLSAPVFYLRMLNGDIRAIIKERVDRPVSDAYPGVLFDPIVVENRVGPLLDLCVNCILPSARQDL